MLLIVLNNSKKTNDLHNELSKTIYDMRNNLNKDFLDFGNNVNNEFANFSERVNSNLIQAHKVTNDVYNNINERIIKIDEAQKGLNDLSKEMLQLQSILSDKKSRGIFGEIELYSLLEVVYGNNPNRYSRQYRLPNGFIADAVIFGGDSMGLLCIDSKFPLENYRRMYDNNLSKEERQQSSKQFSEDIKKHLRDIANKYIIPNVTCDMAYMFVLSEAIFAEIYSSFPQIVDLSYQLKVYIVSPTTLMAYITAIKTIYLSNIKNEKAKEIEILLKNLSIEFERYDKRCKELNKEYENLNNGFKNLAISSDKIIKQFNRINSGEIVEDGKN